MLSPARRRFRGWLLVLWFMVGTLLSACGIQSASSAPGLFTIDALVRSAELDGIDLHIRYAERDADRLTLHLSLYNNGVEDLAWIRGFDVEAARLGTTAPVAHSPNFAGGVFPASGWFVGAASSGSLTFPMSDADVFEFHFPGFPVVPFRLETPLVEPPEPPSLLPSAAFDLGFHAAALRVPGRVLVLDRLVVEPEHVDLLVTVFNRNATEAADELLGDLARTVLLDAQWNAYRAQVAPGAGDEAGAPIGGGTPLLLRFTRPETGGVLLLRVPSFPLIRLSLHAQAYATYAAAADLPPSSEPRAALPLPIQAAAVETRPEIELARVFERLNRAFVERDRETYLSLFAPEMRDEQAALFELAVTLPITAVLLTPLELDDVAEMIDGADLSLQATWSYRIEGVDQVEPFAGDVMLALHHDGDQWRIAGLSGRLPFWAYGPTDVERADAFWIFSRPAARPQLAAMRQELNEALLRVEQYLPGRAEETNVMFVTDTAEEFVTLTGRDAARFLGLAVSRYRIALEGIITTEAAFYINGAAFQNAASGDRQQTMVHELAHLVLAPQTMPFTPVWVVEGMAMHIADDLPEASMRQAIQSGAVAGWSLADFTRQPAFGLHDPSGHQTALEYALAAYLTRFLVERYDFPAVLAFYESFAAYPDDLLNELLLQEQNQMIGGQIMGDHALALLPEKLEESFGTDITTLEQEFLRWLPTQFP